MPVMCMKIERKKETKILNEFHRFFTPRCFIFCAADLLPLRSMQSALEIFLELLTAETTIYAAKKLPM